MKVKISVSTAAMAVACFFALTQYSPSQGVCEAHFRDGVAYFNLDSTSAQFQIDLFGTVPGTLTPWLSTPDGAISFQLGAASTVPSGIGRLYPYNPFLPPPPPPTGPIPLIVILNTQFAGTFSASDRIFADVLAGLGVFELQSTSAPPETGVVSTVPEPQVFSLLACGAVLLFRKRPAAR